MLYILKGYVTKQGGCNIVQVYKTKSAAKKRYNKMVKSGCYEFVEIIEKITIQNSCPTGYTGRREK